MVGIHAPVQCTKAAEPESSSLCISSGDSVTIAGAPRGKQLGRAGLSTGVVCGPLCCARSVIIQEATCHVRGPKEGELLVVSNHVSLNGHTTCLGVIYDHYREGTHGSILCVFAGVVLV